MKLFFAALFAFSMVFGTGASTAFAQCSKDVDCKGERICVEGACVNPTEKEAKVESGAPGDTAPKPAVERRSEGVFVAGLVMTIVGGLSLTGGITLLVLGPSDNNGGLFFAGAIVGGVGVLTVPAGIPMMVWAAKEVPATPEEKTSLRVAPWANSEGGGFALSTTR